jgi:hypothetical protein
VSREESWTAARMYPLQVGTRCSRPLSDVKRSIVFLEVPHPDDRRRIDKLQRFRKSAVE